MNNQTVFVAIVIIAIIITFIGYSGQDNIAGKQYAAKTYNCPTSMELCYTNPAKAGSYECTFDSISGKGYEPFDGFYVFLKHYFGIDVPDGHWESVAKNACDEAEQICGNNLKAAQKAVKDAKESYEQECKDQGCKTLEGKGVNSGCETCDHKRGGAHCKQSSTGVSCEVNSGAASLLDHCMPPGVLKTPGDPNLVSGGEEEQPAN
ncbi:MAG: hypothetical protein ISS93_00505 [Candidatus Aenigmarchaeota archaeon]|nr:hypothetical protein [Candidatus Aenigmarchaeota archaeon]